MEIIRRRPSLSVADSTHTCSTHFMQYTLHQQFQHTTLHSRIYRISSNTRLGIYSLPDSIEISRICCNSTAYSRNFFNKIVKNSNSRKFRPAKYKHYTVSTCCKPASFRINAVSLLNAGGVAQYLRGNDRYGEKEESVHSNNVMEMAKKEAAARQFGVDP